MDIIHESDATLYLRHDGQRLDIDLLRTILLNHCKDKELETARICLHANTRSTLMSMMIIVLNGFKYPPHRHRHKHESYAIIEGECTLVYYDKTGIQISASTLKKGDLAINNTSHFHALEPRSDVLIFIEHTNGPFEPGQNEFL